MGLGSWFKEKMAALDRSLQESDPHMAATVRDMECDAMMRCHQELEAERAAARVPFVRVHAADEQTRDGVLNRDHDHDSPDR
jgi:hypothetical protein